MREILITVTNNKIFASDDFAGYQGEHNATKLLFSLPNELVNAEYSYSVNLTLPDGITATTPLINQELTISNTLTVNCGVLQLQLVITKDSELIYKSGTVNLVIKKSILPNAVIGGGSGVVSAVVDDEGYLIITLTDGTIQNAGYVKGEKGDKGEQGSSYTLTDSDKQEVASKLSADIIKGIIEHSVEALEIPDGTSKIFDYQFQNNSPLRRIIAPNSITEIGTSAFDNCFRLTGIDGLTGAKQVKTKAFNYCYSLTDLDDLFFENVEAIGDSAFEKCYSFERINPSLPNCKSIGNSVFADTKIAGRLSLPNCKSIGALAFHNCVGLTSIELGSLETIASNAFNVCINIEFVDLGTDFNCNGLNLSMSTKYSAETLAGVVNSLKDRTGKTAYTLNLGSVNLAKLTDEQKAIATNKNWVLK